MLLSGGGSSGSISLGWIGRWIGWWKRHTTITTAACGGGAAAQSGSVLALVQSLIPLPLQRDGSKRYHPADAVTIC